MKQAVELCIASIVFLFIAGPAWAVRTHPGGPFVHISLLSPRQQQQRLAADRRTLKRCRESLQELVRFMSSRPDVFPVTQLEGKRLLSEQDKAIARGAWLRLSDNLLALEALKQSNADFYKIKAKQSETDAFCVFYGAFLAQYRFALAFLDMAENDPSLDIVLNEASPEMGLPEGTYAPFKFYFLNVAIATQYAALNAAYAYYKDAGAGTLAAGIRDDRAYIWSTGKGRGVKLTAKNALRIVTKAGFAVWLPVQKEVAEWMGDTKVWRKQVVLISQEQIRDFLPLLEPGDVLFERREWHVSNVGLPGFWAHAALYVGTPEERREFFSGDEELRQWINSNGGEDVDFEHWLQTQFPDAYRRGKKPREAGHVPRVLEAIGTGVSFTTIEHSAACDSLAVLRPRLSKKEKARAIVKAFQYSGRPYDFNFDFLTDASLVCSELIYKCYEPASGFTGLSFPLRDMLGRKVTPPNDMVRQFDTQFGTRAQQTDFVLFYDGREFERKAVSCPVDEFRKSWTRPKWHVLTRWGKKQPQ